VSDALVVHVNRDELHGLAVPDSFEAGESFDVVLVNHGESTHVHLHLDDALSEQAALEAPNHHVEGGSERRVRVTRTAEGSARGNLKVVTAYGATTRLVAVHLTEPMYPDDGVEVGEELTTPAPRDDGGDEAGTGTLPVGPIVVAGGLVLALAVGTAAVVGSSVAVVAAVGIGLVALGVVAATLMVGP